MQLLWTLVVAASAYVANDKDSFLQKEGVMEHSAAYATSEVPPVSTTMKAVINLTIQYFILYTAVAVVRTYNELNKGAPLVKGLQVVEDGCRTVNFAPMLCVLFVGVRMRALQLSQGEPDKYNLPQPWVKDSMLMCAWSVLAQTILVLIVPFLLGDAVKVAEDGTPKVEGSSMLAKVLTVIRYVAMAALYGGFTTVCVGAFMMEAPTSIYPGGAPPVSPAVASTMNLAAQYFGVYLAIALVNTWTDFNGSTDFTKKFQGILQMATNTVNFAPMLCILFIGARMRALQIDPLNGNPQRWAQYCFFGCAYAVLAQLVLIFAIPLALGGSVEREEGAAEGDVTFKLENKTALAVLTAIRYAVMLALYGGFTAVIVSVHIITDKNGNIPPVSPAMQCVMNLTLQFFTVYLLLWVSITLKQFVEGLKNILNICIPTFVAAQKTVQFCPMLCVLFIGLRLRALQITDQKGAPQGWAQQGMFLSTYAVMFQLLMVLLLPIFTQGPPETDKDGNVVSKEGSTGFGAWFLVIFRYLALLALYGGAVTCVVALFKITPETATGTGSLVPGVDIPVPPSATGA